MRRSDRLARVGGTYRRGNEQAVHGYRRAGNRSSDCEEIHCSRDPDAERADEREQRQHERNDREKDHGGEAGDREPDAEERAA